MRQGYDPEMACKMTIERIIKKEPNYKNLQVGFLALRKDGAIGGYALHKGFNYALMTSTENNSIVDAKHII
jgi:isoaspartyl peptidase/L-asparaginase-like protein (Ntn-hydrolase superfamily)